MFRYALDQALQRCLEGEVIDDDLYESCMWELRFWQAHYMEFSTTSAACLPWSPCVVVCDTSDSQTAAVVVRGQFIVSAFKRQLTEAEKELSSLTRELLGVEMVLEANPDWHDCRLKCIGDNKGMSVCLPKLGSRAPSAVEVLRRIWEMVSARNIALHADWCRREFGLLPFVDSLSKEAPLPECPLSVSSVSQPMPVTPLAQPALQGIGRNAVRALAQLVGLTYQRSWNLSRRRVGTIFPSGALVSWNLDPLVKGSPFHGSLARFGQTRLGDWCLWLLRR